MNPYAFNTNAQYPAKGGFPRNLGARDVQDAHIQVMIPEDGRGDFTTQFQDIFGQYRLPHFNTENVINLWNANPMGFYQNQVNFAVWCSTTGSGVSWRDHLDIDQPLARALFRFHVYYQVRRILDELQAPLPQDRAWAPFQNPYDQRAYERICREFQVDPATDWRQKDSKSGGLGTVYQYNHGYQPKGSFNKRRMRFQPDRSLSASSSLWGREHIDYIAQGQEADEAWTGFVLDISQGFTAPGVERLNDSIRTYVWAILGAQVQTRSGILGEGTSFDAQKQFMANVEDAIASPVDIPSAIERYQSVLQNASSKVDYSFGTGLYMAPSDMRLHIGTIAGYNNKILIAPVGQALGVSADMNSPVMQAPTALEPSQYRRPVRSSKAPSEHEEEKRALIVGSIAVGLLLLWLFP